MTIETSITNRRELASALAQYLNTRAIYLGPPTFAYQIGDIHLSREGILSGDDLDGMLRMEEKRKNKRIVSRMPVLPSMLAKKRVAAYARVSLDKEAMLRSLAAQVGYYSDLIRKNSEWEYAGVFADEGLTGTKENRPQFQRLLTDCRAGKIDMVLVKYIS